LKVLFFTTALSFLYLLNPYLILMHFNELTGILNLPFKIFEYILGETGMVMRQILIELRNTRWHD